MESFSQRSYHEEIASTTYLRGREIQQACNPYAVMCMPSHQNHIDTLHARQRTARITSAVELRVAAEQCRSTAGPSDPIRK